MYTVYFILNNLQFKKKKNINRSNRKKCVEK